MTLRIDARALAAIRAEAEAAWPHECCGLLVGLRRDAGVTVLHAVGAANVAEDPARRFEVDPALLLATHRKARESGEEVLGPYHSHPEGAATPSAIDLARARDGGEAGAVWVILPVVQGRAGAPRAWVFDGAAFAGVAVETAEPGPGGA